MKSREEYQASIFAKRDALLAKRKKRITQAVTVSCAVILLTASAAAIPSFIRNPAPDTVQAEHTTTVSEAYGSVITQPNADYDNLSESTEPVKDLTEAVTEKAEAAAEAVPEGATEMPTVVVRYPVSKEHSNYPFIEKETIGAVDEAVSESSSDDGISPEFQNEMYFEAERSPEEIAEAAFGYLSDEQKAECINADSPEIINITSSAGKHYTVSFKTNGKTVYQVQLGHPNLELIEIGTSTEKEIASEPATYKPGYKGGTK